LYSHLLSKNLKIKIHKTTVLPDVFHQQFKLREDHILRVFENKVLRRILGPKTEEVAEDWRKLLNGEVHNTFR
jgi:hypothetical protein